MYLFYHVGKEPDGTQFLLLDYMNISVAQIIEARSGNSFSKWPNGEIPYTFDFTSIEGYQEGLSEAEQNIVKKVVARFNKDLNGCVSIRLFKKKSIKCIIHILFQVWMMRKETKFFIVNQIILRALLKELMA